MNTIIGSTTSETNMIKAIQRAVGAAEDGMIGGETMAAVATKLGRTASRSLCGSMGSPRSSRGILWSAIPGPG